MRGKTLQRGGRRHAHHDAGACSQGAGGTNAGEGGGEATLDRVHDPNSGHPRRLRVRCVQSHDPVGSDVSRKEVQHRAGRAEADASAPALPSFGIDFNNNFYLTKKFL